MFIYNGSWFGPMAEFASKGVAGTALGLGAGALGVELLRGGLGGLLGGYNNIPSESMPVTRYEAGKDSRIAELETEVKLRDANIYTDQKLNDFRNYVDRKFDHVEHELCDQRAFNAGIMGKVGCIGDQVAELMGLTKRVVPNGSICPGWGDVTVSITPATDSTTTG